MNRTDSSAALIPYQMIDLIQQFAQQVRALPEEPDKETLKKMFKPVFDEMLMEKQQQKARIQQEREDVMIELQKKYKREEAEKWQRRVTYTMEKQCCLSLQENDGSYNTQIVRESWVNTLKICLAVLLDRNILPAEDCLVVDLPPRKTFEEINSNLSTHHDYVRPNDWQDMLPLTQISSRTPEGLAVLRIFEKGNYESHVMEFLIALSQWLMELTMSLSVKDSIMEEIIEKTEQNTKIQDSWFQMKGVLEEINSNTDTVSIAERRLFNQINRIQRSIAYDHQLGNFAHWAMRMKINGWPNDSSVEIKRARKRYLAAKRKRTPRK